jgi:hypothetical protein
MRIVRPAVSVVAAAALLGSGALVLSGPAQAAGYARVGYCKATAPGQFFGATMYGTDFTLSGTLWREVTAVELGSHGEKLDVVVDCIYQGDLWQSVPGDAPKKIGTRRWSDRRQIVHP